jgi:hypothetical protein
LQCPLMTQSGHSVSPNRVGESSVTFDLTGYLPRRRAREPT